MNPLAHYAGFFKLKPTENFNSGELEYIFDWRDLRKITDSFIDSIIVELCFPRGKYPKAILYQLLGDAVSESPNDAKRFPQALWDAMGHLSVNLLFVDVLFYQIILGIVTTQRVARCTIVRSGRRHMEKSASSTHSGIRTLD